MLYATKESETPPWCTGCYWLAGGGGRDHVMGWKEGYKVDIYIYIYIYSNKHCVDI